MTLSAIGMMDSADQQKLWEARKLSMIAIQNLCKQTQVNAMSMSGKLELVEGYALGGYTLARASGSNTLYVVRNRQGLTVTGAQMRITKALRFLWLCNEIASELLDSQGRLDQSLPSDLIAQYSKRLRMLATALEMGTVTE